MKLTIDTYDFHFEELTDKQRTELIKELVLSAYNAQEFQQKIIKTIEKLEID